ncbi:Ger(x)C family spore germination protein [Niallia oryzisoli]|uniref:Ger(x)C family spore germination protein n=1 Tax=Niallia oryzisoli TaxID=1737571 RepID=UPI003736CE25
MGKGSIVCIFFCIQLIITTGCWDRKELNDRSIWLATGWDVGEKEDEIQICGQIAIPANMQSQTGGGSGGGSKSESYVTVSEKGKSVQDALETQQNKLSREAYFGQRRVVLYGEKFAKHGLKEEIDINSRSSDVSIRTDVFVVKGDTALQALNLSNPFESPPAVAALKVHEQAGGRGDVAYLDFIIAANSDGIRPTIPAIDIDYFQHGNKDAKGEAAKPILKLAGLAVFDPDLKLAGFLNMDENWDFLWVTNRLNKKKISVSQNGKGNASLALTKIHGEIIPKMRNGQITFTVELSGEGGITENNNNLDIDKRDNIKLLKHAMEKQTKEEVLATITKVQKEFGLDIFGFGEAVHKRYPQQWKKVKKDWDTYFAEANISVDVDLKIRRIGMTGPSLLYKESEIKE